MSEKKEDRSLKESLDIPADQTQLAKEYMKTGWEKPGRAIYWKERGQMELPTFTLEAGSIIAEGEATSGWRRAGSWGYGKLTQPIEVKVTMVDYDYAEGVLNDGTIINFPPSYLPAPKFVDDTQVAPGMLIAAIKKDIKKVDEQDELDESEKK